MLLVVELPVSRRFGHSFPCVAISLDESSHPRERSFLSRQRTAAHACKEGPAHADAVALADGADRDNNPDPSTA